MNDGGKLTRFFFLRKQCESEDEYQEVLKLSAKDSVALGKRTVFTIILFELIMIGSTIFMHDWDIQRILYFGGYLFLLIVSVYVWIELLYLKRAIRERYRKIRSISTWYGAALILWAIYMTIADNYFNPSFSILILITILVIIPVVTFMEPIWYLFLHCLGSASVFVVIWTMTENGRFGNTINFAVFSIISLISGLSFFEIRKNAYLKQAELAERANRDSLSTLYNRQMLTKVSASVWKACRGNKSNVACILCDIDDFKKINDEHGHLMGDEWIRSVSAIIKKAAHENKGMAFRYGGEEFLILLPDKSAAEAAEIVESMQLDLINVVNAKQGNLHVTLSFGIYAAIPESENCELEKYLSRADDLMYEAKQKGKDQYCLLQDN